MKHFRIGAFCLGFFLSFGICFGITMVKADDSVGTEKESVNEQVLSLTAGFSSESIDILEEIEEVQTINYNKIGWTTANVNVRTEPNTDCEAYEVYDYNTKIEYAEYNDNWVLIKYNNKIAYMSKDYISDEKMPEITYTDYSVPDYSGIKSWMPYTAITSTSSPQYILQHQYAYTGNYGIRMVGDRYCVAIGSHFGVSIGQYFDLILENGTVIKCISGDEKADCDTDSANIFSRNGCASEFIIDSSALASSIRRSGDTSSACEAWDSKVVTIRVYDKNILK